MTAPEIAPMTVPVDADVHMTATCSVTHLCPFKDEVDRGGVTVKWSTNGRTFELHALAAYLQAFAEERISHEDLTDRFRRTLAFAPGVTGVEVTTVWETAGMGVTCST